MPDSANRFNSYIDIKKAVFQLSLYEHCSEHGTWIYGYKFSTSGTTYRVGLKESQMCRSLTLGHCAAKCTELDCRTALFTNGECLICQKYFRFLKHKVSSASDCEAFAADTMSRSFNESTGVCTVDKGFLGSDQSDCFEFTHCSKNESCVGLLNGVMNEGEVKMSQLPESRDGDQPFTCLCGYDLRVMDFVGGDVLTSINVSHILTFWEACSVRYFAEKQVFNHGIFTDGQNVFEYHIKSLACTCKRECLMTEGCEAFSIRWLVPWHNYNVTTQSKLDVDVFEMISQVKLDELPEDRIIEIINEMSPRQMADEKHRNSELWHYIRVLLEPDKLVLVEVIDSVLPQEATDFSLPQLDQQERTDTSPYCDEFAQEYSVLV